MVIIGQVTPPSSGMAFCGEKVELKIGQHSVGSGTVYISQNALVWRSDDATQNGISIFWKRVGVHGISNAPTKCIYFMVDRQIKWPGLPEELNNAGDNANGQLGSGDDEDGASDEDVYEDAEEGQLTECWLLPDDINLVDSMYQAMTECQAMHPDSGDSVSDEMMEEDEDGINGEGFDSCSEDVGELTNGDANSEDVQSAQVNMDNMSLNEDRYTDANE